MRRKKMVDWFQFPRVARANSTGEKLSKTPNTKGVVFELLGCLLKNKSFKELWVLWVSKLNHKIEEAGKRTHKKNAHYSSRKNLHARDQFVISHLTTNIYF